MPPGRLPSAPALVLSMDAEFRLVPLSRTGVPVRTGSGDAPPFPDELPPAAAGLTTAVADLAARVGYDPPWICYLVANYGECVGCGGFKSPPCDGRVEIAYSTFPPHEGRGFATRIAAELVRLAALADPTLIVAAQTLPTESASTTILRKLGFECVGEVDHPEDGRVFEWQRPPGRPL